MITTKLNDVADLHMDAYVAAHIKNTKLWANQLPKIPVILISGKAGAGKTTLAAMMHERLFALGVKTSVLSFAKAVKVCATSSFGWDGVKDDKGRQLLQNIGHMGREYNPNIWVDRVVSMMEELIFANFNCFILDDWRYPNEYEVIKKSNYFTVFTVLVTGIESLSGKNAEHPSEHALDNFGPYNFVLDNSLRDPGMLNQLAVHVLQKIFFNKEF